MTLVPPTCHGCIFSGHPHLESCPEAAHNKYSHFTSAKDLSASPPLSGAAPAPKLSQFEQEEKEAIERIYKRFGTLDAFYKYIAEHPEALAAAPVAVPAEPKCILCGKIADEHPNRLWCSQSEDCTMQFTPPLDAPPLPPSQEPTKFSPLVEKAYSDIELSTEWREHIIALSEALTSLANESEEFLSMADVPQRGVMNCAVLRTKIDVAREVLADCRHHRPAALAGETRTEARFVDDKCRYCNEPQDGHFPAMCGYDKCNGEGCEIWILRPQNRYQLCDECLLKRIAQLERELKELRGEK